MASKHIKNYKSQNELFWCNVPLYNFITYIKGKILASDAWQHDNEQNIRPKKGEVRKNWTKLHNMELCDSYSSPNIITAIKSRRMKHAGHVSCMEDGRNAHRILLWKHERKIPLERCRHTWESNIKTDLAETGWEGVDCTDLALGRDSWQTNVNTGLNLWVFIFWLSEDPLVFKNDFTSCN